MKRFLSQYQGMKVLMGLALVIGLLFSTGQDAFAFDKPAVPNLTLTGTDDGYNEEWYPDGRIWIPTSEKYEHPREFLVPVWIENRWAKYDDDRFVPDPIYSFQFTLLYDSSAIRPVGVQKFGPRDEEMDQEPLSKHFNISWHDFKDTSRYRVYLSDETALQDRMRGRAMRITGTSTTRPLPNTDLGRKDWQILLYVRFKVMQSIDNPGQGSVAKPSIHFAPDTIKYNDINVREDNPFAHLYKLGIPGTEQYEPTEITGLAGINNLDYAAGEIEPTKEGSIYMSITPAIPEFNFSIERGIGSIPAIKKVEDEENLWEIVDPITIDSASFDPLFGTRLLRVMNGVERTRLLDIEVETDQKWLKLQARRLSTADKYPADFASPTRSGWIDWLDNTILGEERDPYGDPTTAEGDLYLEVQCDPNEIQADDEKAGVYTGYITFRSDYALDSPVRIKVTFIYFRNPVEWFNTTSKPGIELTVRNSRGAVGDSCKLIFGTGHRATDGVDQLFGEFAYEYDLQGFGARFYPVDTDIQPQVPFGFGDWAPNDELPRTAVRDENGNLVYGSRDIRSAFDTLQSITYWVKFNAGGAENYPITIEWDTKNFPDGAQLFLRDARNGEEFNVNMRSATPLPNGRLSYVITDPKYSEFMIEYTLPKVIRYVNADGTPRINPGWNLLSLPVRPTNSFWNVFYPNAMNVPIKFTLSIYQQEEELMPGVGYFVKYSEDRVDTTFQGVFISKISKATGDPVRLYKGWNTIGALSIPINIDHIDLDAFDNNNRPTLSESMKLGVYGYKTNRGYVEVSELEPGLGYWLYVDAGAWLNLDMSNIKTGSQIYASNRDDVMAMSDAIVLRDNSQNEASLYLSNQNVDANSFVLPPLPPADLFDVRFDNNSKLSTENSSVVLLQAVEYPASFAVHNADAKYTFSDPVTGQIYGTIEKGSNGTVVIPSSKTNSVKIENSRCS